MSYFLVLIQFIAVIEGVDPTLATAVAYTESSLRPDVTGPVGEVGLFQVRPEFSLIPKPLLRRPSVNVTEGLRKLKNAKRRCKYGLNKQYVICYNTGVSGGYRVSSPTEHPYYLKVMSNYAKYKPVDKGTIIPYRL
jgi:soluble lytic murein transglycosylase-like protein